MEQKYGVMEIKDGDKIVAYVVAKCTVIKQTDYSINGKKNSIFHIVFEWNPNGENNIAPIYDVNGNCINAVMTDKVFDNLTNCKKVTEELNDQIAKDEIKNAKIYEVRELAKKLRETFQKALNMQEEHLKQKTTEIIK